VAKVLPPRVEEEPVVAEAAEGEEAEEGAEGEEGAEREAPTGGAEEGDEG
jgi:hypothetical protein